MARLDLSDADIDREMSRVRSELAERDRTLRGGRPFPNLKGKTVILVDDGLASGYTMKAAVLLASKRQAARTILDVLINGAEAFFEDRQGCAC